MLHKQILLVSVVGLFLLVVASSGKGATTYTLNTDNTEILEDVRILASAGAINQNGNDLGVQRENGNDISSFLKYNLTSLPTGKIVTNATFCGFTFEVYNGGLLLHTRHVENYTWTEESITWNTNPCTAGNCNTTIQGVQSDVCANGVFCCVDVTNGVAKDYALGLPNTSFLVNTSEQTPIKNCMFRDKETGTNPYLNITLEDAPTTTTSSTTTTTEETTTTANTTTTVFSCPTMTNTSERCCKTTDYLYIQNYEWRNNTLSTFNETVFCEHGCSSIIQICNPAPIYVWIGIILIVGLILWVLKRLRLI